MKRLGRILPWLAPLLVVGVASPARAGVVIGAEGQAFSALTGTYGDLVAGGVATDADSPVLVLEVKRPNESAQRLLVPDSEDWRWEDAPALVYEDASRTVYLVWVSWSSPLHPAMNLIGFGPDGWSERIEVTGDPYAAKSAPAVALTRDTLLGLGADGELAQLERTLLHLVWTQEGAGGAWEAMYAPVLFVDGMYVGQTPILRLDELVPADEALTGPVSMTAQVNSPVVRPGRDATSVVVGYHAGTTGLFRTVGIQLVPADLARLAGGARAHIIDTGARAETPTELRSIADGARAHIIDTGIAFDPNVVRSLADGARAHIIDTGVTVRSDDDLRRLAADARAHIIDTGVSLSHGLRRAVSAQAKVSAQLTVGSTEERAGEHVLFVSAASDRAAPDLPVGDVSVFLSKRGTDAIIAWSDGTGVFYRETEGSEWSAVRTIEVGPNLGTAAAFEALAERISHR